MNCQECQALAADHLLKHLAPGAELQMQDHLALCAHCQRELDHVEAMWGKLGLLPVESPSPAMRQRFYETLAAYQQGATHAPVRPSAWEWIRSLWPAQPALQMALAAGLLVVGFTVGREGKPAAPAPAPVSQEQIQKLQSEVSSMRQLVALSLLQQQQSASERLRGIDYSYRVDKPNNEVLTALLHTINDDSNMSVRLAAVDALQKYAADPLARQGIRHSVMSQESPLVQIALIDLLVQWRDKASLPLVTRLHDDPQMNETVRRRASWAQKRLTTEIQ